MTPSSVTAPYLVAREYRAGRVLCMCGCGGVAPTASQHRAVRGVRLGEPQMFIRGHRHRRDAVARFWEKVDRDAPNGCWQWLGSLAAKGYGALLVNGQRVRVHRFAYELLVGPIPPDLVLDHLCRNRGCVNPAHLEAVTNWENLRRGEGAAATAMRKKGRC